ncbi:MAG: toll/interleukin-1 receptor domain-containing protein [Candidatus Rokuibacteriota bacterium]
MGHVFVSYAHQDAAVATRLERALKDARVNVWRDREGIRPGEAFQPVLQRGLAAADLVLVVVSKASVRSPWVSLGDGGSVEEAGTGDSCPGGRNPPAGAAGPAGRRGSARLAAGSAP